MLVRKVVPVLNQAPRYEDLSLRLTKHHVMKTSLHLIKHHAMKTHPCA